MDLEKLVKDSLYVPPAVSGEKIEPMVWDKSMTLEDFVEKNEQVLMSQHGEPITTEKLYIYYSSENKEYIADIMSEYYRDFLIKE